MKASYLTSLVVILIILCSTSVAEAEAKMCRRLSPVLQPMGT